MDLLALAGVPVLVDVELDVLVAVLRLVPVLVPVPVLELVAVPLLVEDDVPGFKLH